VSVDAPNASNSPLSGPAPSWGSARGFLAFEPIQESSRRDVLDSHLIQERIARYGWSFDERRADLLAQCFTQDAVWSGDIGGTSPVAPVSGRDDIVSWLSEFWPRQSDQRRHLMMSVSILHQEPESAKAVSSLLLTSASSETLSVVLTSFYRFELAKSDGIWRISELFEGCDLQY
jgi:hypothetical protein